MYFTPHRVRFFCVRKAGIEHRENSLVNLNITTDEVDFVTKPQRNKRYSLKMCVAQSSFLMRKRLCIFCVLLSSVGLTYAEAGDKANVLWYEQAAADWNEALPIGNGRIGAMVFGGVQNARFQLNEETLWSGEPGNNNVPAFKKALPKIRASLQAKRYEKAQPMANEFLPRQPKTNINYGMPYKP